MYSIVKDQLTENYIILPKIDEEHRTLSYAHTERTNYSHKQANISIVINKCNQNHQSSQFLCSM